jgi:hypothetical protein
VHQAAHSFNQVHVLVDNLTIYSSIPTIMIDIRA